MTFTVNRIGNTKYQLKVSICKTKCITTSEGKWLHFDLSRDYNRDTPNCQFRRKDLATHENILLTGLNVIYILRNICFNYSY
jgi:hypothetical protein